MTIESLDGAALKLARRTNWLVGAATLPLDWHSSLPSLQRVAENLGYEPAYLPTQHIRITIQANPGGGASHKSVDTSPAAELFHLSPVSSALTPAYPHVSANTASDSGSDKDHRAIASGVRDQRNSDKADAMTFGMTAPHRRCEATIAMDGSLSLRTEQRISIEGNRLDNTSAFGGEFVTQTYFVQAPQLLLKLQME